MYTYEQRKTIDSAGAIVFRGKGAGREVLMISGHGKWSFPKGHIEAGEQAESAAVREVREETGIEIALLPDFRFAVPSGRPGEKRKVIYFLGEARGGELTADYRETAGCAWQRAEEAELLLRFPQDAPALRAALRAIQDFY